MFMPENLLTCKSSSVIELTVRQHGKQRRLSTVNVAQDRHSHLVKVILFGFFTYEVLVDVEIGRVNSLSTEERAVGPN